MKIWLASTLLTLSLTLLISAQDQKSRVGGIEFFGTAGIDVQNVRAHLPIQIGSEVDINSIDETKRRIRESVNELTGTEPTDVSPVCCDPQGQLWIYIGLRGKNYQSLRYNKQLNGSATLPESVVALYREEMDLLAASIHNQATEDDSQGYALSTYPPLRAKQLAMREFAYGNADLIQRVLKTSSDSEQRSIAAQLLGYTNRSSQQIRLLVHASRDSSEGVRNNAVRALGVLARSVNEAAKTIPAEPFVNMLNSGTWTDRNKGTLVLEVLSRTRRRQLLNLLRRQAADSLIEMARWHEPGHADTARQILGRIAGIEEKRLQLMVANHEAEAIINEFLKTTN
jgi:hypothetical protein